MITTNEKIQHAANHSTVTASATSVSTTISGPSSRQSIIDTANSSLEAQRSYDYLRDGKFGKFPKTTYPTATKHKTKHSPTLKESSNKQGTVEEDTIQDDKTLDFGAGSQKILQDNVGLPRHRHNQAYQILQNFNSSIQTHLPGRQEHS
jgi:hypothetical protein